MRHIIVVLVIIATIVIVVLRVIMVLTVVIATIAMIVKDPCGFFHLEKDACLLLGWLRCFWHKRSVQDVYSSASSFSGLGCISFGVHMAS